MIRCLKKWYLKLRLAIRVAITVFAALAIYRLHTDGISRYGREWLQSSALIIGTLCYCFPYYVKICNRIPVSKFRDTVSEPEWFIELVGFIAVVSVGSVILF